MAALRCSSVVCRLTTDGLLPLFLNRLSFHLGKNVLTAHKLLLNNIGVKASKFHQSTGEDTGQIKKTKLWKRLFSTLLFGATLGTAVYIKKKRTASLKDLLRDCKRLPIDENYENKEAQHMYLYNGYVLHLTHVKALREMTAFQAMDDDIYVASFPKAGKSSWFMQKQL